MLQRRQVAQHGMGPLCVVVSSVFAGFLGGRSVLLFGCSSWLIALANQLRRSLATVLGRAAIVQGD